jgi:hypothetical protein
MIVANSGGLGDSQGLDALSQILAASNTPTTVDVNATPGQGQFNIANYTSYFVWGLVGLVTTILVIR